MYCCWFCFASFCFVFLYHFSLLLLNFPFLFSSIDSFLCWNLKSKTTTAHTHTHTHWSMQKDVEKNDAIMNSLWRKEINHNARARAPSHIGTQERNMKILHAFLSTSCIDVMRVPFCLHSLKNYILRFVKWEKK